MSPGEGESETDRQQHIYFRSCGRADGTETHILYELKPGEEQTGAWITSKAALDVKGWR